MKITDNGPVRRSMRSSMETVKRPALVEEALKANQPLYYFGLGSNMSRRNLENRIFHGEKIHVLSMEPAVVHNYRLAFNFRAFLPSEPVMGSLEHVGVDENALERGNPSIPLYPYEKAECHGALILLSADDYEKIMHSEGVSGDHHPVRSYEEVVVRAVPYDSTKSPVQAVALRAYPHARLSRDAAPSARYMKILRDGAAELGLSKCYQVFLAAHPVQVTPVWLQLVALPNLVLTMSLMFSESRWPTQVIRFQYTLLYLVYVYPTSPAPLRMLSYVAQAILLIPGSMAGLGLLAYRKLTNTRHPPAVERFLGFMNKQTSQKGDEKKKAS
jgi:hypothetical protein